MTRRPLCLVCLVLVVGIWLWQKWGAPFASLLPPPIAAEFAEGGPAVVWGKVLRQTKGEGTNSVYLTQTYLIYHSDTSSATYDLANLRVFLKNEYEAEAGSYIKIKGELRPVPGRKNPGEFDARSYYAARKIYYFLDVEEILAKREARFPFRRWLQQFSSYFNRVLSQIQEGDEGILSAMILGEKSQVESEVKAYYQMAGMLHLLAEKCTSGYICV